MSKQLSFSALAAVATMALFALSASAGHFDAPTGKTLAGHAPLTVLAARS